MKMKKIIMVVFTIAASALMLAGCTQKVDPEKFCTATYDGINTKGTASVQIDQEALNTAVLGTMPTNQADQHEYEQKARKLAGAVSTTLNTSTGLSNGDVLTATLTCDKSAQEELNFHLSKETVSFTVSNLPEATPIDVFKDIEIRVLGIAPRAYIDILNNSTNPFLETVSYSADPSSNLDIGSTVTITATYDSAYAESCLYAVEKDTLTYTVPDEIDRYVATYEEIDADTQTAIKQEALDLVNAFIAKNGDVAYRPLMKYYFLKEMDACSFGEVSVDRAYFFKLKGSDYSGEENMLLVMCSTTGTASESSDSYKGTACFPVVFRDIVNSNGSTNVNLANATLGEIEKTSDDLYVNWVTADKDRYTVKEIDLTK